MTHVAIDYKIGDDGTVTERRLPDAAFEDTTTEVITAVVEIAVAQPREDAHKRCFDFLELTTEQVRPREQRRRFSLLSVALRCS